MPRIIRGSSQAIKIEELYLTGLSGRQIAERLGLGKSQVLNFIKSLGISRGNLEWLSDLSKKEDAYQKSSIKRKGIAQPKIRKYDINLNLFKNLDDPFEAYLFGIIFTDGSINKANTTISLMVSNSDKEWLDDISYKLNIPSRIDNRGYPYFNLNSIEVGLTLQSLGIDNEKTKNPKNIIIPNNEIDFLRGLIDGDGSICIDDKNYPTIYFGNTNKFIVEWVANKFKATGAKAKVHLLNEKPWNNNAKRPYKLPFYEVKCSGSYAKKILEQIYYDGCFAIPRKIVKANEGKLWQKLKV